MIKPILMKFNILSKYLEDHKKGYIKFLVKLYFKVGLGTLLKFFKIYSFDWFNIAYGQWSPVGAFKALAPSCMARPCAYGLLVHIFRSYKNRT